MNYDSYEIHPCILLDGQHYEQCDEDNPNIAVWSVYGHIPTGGLECISDHATKDEAEKALSLLNPPLGKT